MIREDSVFCSEDLPFFFFFFCCISWSVVLVLVLHQTAVISTFSIFYLSFNKARQGCGYREDILVK